VAAAAVLAFLAALFFAPGAPALGGIQDGPGASPETEGTVQVGLTLVLLLDALGPEGTLALNGRPRWWPAPDRQRLGSGVAGVAASLAVAYLLSAWLTLPGPLWAVAFARTVSTGIMVALSAAIILGAFVLG
jgi:hypothetical protein